MKNIVIVGDGMADEPRPELDGKTLLQYAETPHFDYLAERGELGLVTTVPEGLPPGSDVANLSVMGYDPTRHYTGRSPLEAVSMGIELADDDVSFRCNLVTLSEEAKYHRRTMVSYSGGEVETEEAHDLIEHLNRHLGDAQFRFYPGISYRHILVWRRGKDGSKLTPPHDISDRVVGKYLPSGPGAEELMRLMKESTLLLGGHRVNLDRQARGKLPANSAWFWGQGRRPSLPRFGEKYGLRGAVISAVDLIKGIGMCAGLRVINVEGATGTITTDFKAKALAALNTLRDDDFVLVHVEAPDEAGHQGDMETKIKAIREIDEKVVGVILKGMEGQPFRLMLLPDHPTPIATKTHTSDPVPFVIYRSEDKLFRAGRTYNERSAAEAPLRIHEGHRLMDYFLKTDRGQ